MTTARAGAAAVLLVVAAACSTRTVERERASPPRRQLVLLVVDGLDAREVDDGETPFLARAWRDSRWCPGVHARAAMPARTNVNHATLLTGVPPAVHGITGNAFWGRGAESPRKLGASPDFLVETLFTVAQASVPPVRTAAAVGKAKLDLMFADTAGQSAPSRTWRPKDAPESGRDPVTGYAFDAATLAGAGALLGDEPNFVLVNLADVDRVSHGFGPHSSEARNARRATDAAVAAFVERLRQRPTWGETTVVVTADHGFDSVEHPPIDFGERLGAAGLAADLVSVNDGGVAHVYLRDRASPKAAGALERARRLALDTAGIAEALYLGPNPTDGGDAHRLATLHPEWRLDHERAGDLFLVAAPGYVLADVKGDELRLKGNHGAPAELDVPVIVIGAVGSATGSDCAGVTAADLGRTLLRCLGLRDVSSLGGDSVPDAARGRILPHLCS